eukprot:comp21300_c0_seq2/m.45678 comp21300_c0_seq2/g.45678  ORF comp21300_c0_seq2/g.45678 comp21300_c0_seq2/m.45678 type:complete len:441 (-) comp21300_c0_seq2:9-1331(-)
MSDILSVLRDAIIRRVPMTLSDEHIVIDNAEKLDRKQQTSYKGTNGDFFKLEEVYFLVSQKWAQISQYVVEANRSKIKVIPVIDRKDLIDYMTGQVETSKHIEAIHSLSSVSRKRARSVSPVAAEPISSAKEIRARERAVRNRGSLLVASKGFDAVLRIIEGVKLAAWEAAERKSMLMAQLEREKNVHKNRYEEKDPGVDGNLPGAEDFKIDMHGTFASSAAAKQKEIEKSIKERELEREKEKDKIATGVSSIAASLEAGAASASTSVFSTHPPIILVPAAMNALINSYNAKEFLENKNWVDIKEMNTLQLEKKMRVVRQEDTLQEGVAEKRKDWIRNFDLVDDPKKLAPQDWERVVCIFVLGKKWQFKDCVPQEPVLLLNKYPGIFFCLEDEVKLHSDIIKNWNLNVILFSKSSNKKYKEMIECKKVWKIIDTFMDKKR